MAKIRKKNNNEDAGRKIIDSQLEGLESDISSLYAKASKEMKNKSDAFLDEYVKKDQKMRARRDAGEITDAQYKSWRNGQLFQSEAMSAKVADLTQTMVNADKEAMAMVNDTLPEVYATGYNYAGYRGEKYSAAVGKDYTSFTIYNRDAVRKLAKDDPDLLPAPRVDIPKDERWNRQHIQNAISQGIIQGEPVSDISRRLQAVTNMDNNAALRNARTAVNGIENKARNDATEQLIADGVPMVFVWSSTHDERTRDSHVLLDGEVRAEDGYFSNGLEYPADPNGEPEEVYNCRCCLLTQIAGIDHSKDDELYDQFQKENDYESWLALKENDQQQAKEQAFQQHKAEALAKRAEAEQLRQKLDIIPDNISSSMLDVIGEKGLPIETEKLLKTVNPNFPEKGYTDNCMRTSVCYELGRRGYDVEAGMFDGSYIGLNHVFDISSQSRSGEYYGTYITSEKVNPRMANPKYPFNQSSKTTANSITQAMKDWGEGSRAELCVTWKRGGDHAVNVENIGGKIVIIDTQCGMTFDNVEGYLSRTKCTETELRRTDILNIRDNVPQDILSRICKKRG